MKIRYTIIAALILLTLAFARGVVVVPHAGDFSILSTLHAFADDSGDGGDGGDTGGDSGDTGNTGGDSGDTGSTTTGGEAPGGTTPTPVPGVCNTTTFNSCSSGTLGANAQQPDGSYHWYCDGVDGGATSPLCVYVPPSAGVCDYTGPNQCTVGTLGNNAVQPDGSYQWYCNSPNGGATSPLCFYVPPVTPTNTIGACNYTQANSCANGTLGAHEIQPDGSYHWYCDGTPNTTENRSPLCFYVPPQTPVNGVCSTVIDSCTSGVPQTPGIQPNGDHHWYCNGTGGGTNSPLCTYAPLKCEITVDKSSVTSGSPVILSWTTNRIINANSTFTISNGVGAANVNGGSTTVNPVVTTTYRGTLYDNLDFSPRLEATCSATVTVTNPPAVTWTPYCTGGNDLNGHNWQIWEVDNSVPPNYRFKEMGSVANGCVPPTVTPSTIKVVKIVINDNSGTKQVADFPLFVNSTSVVSGAINTFTPGSYTVSETNLPGYASSFSGDCDANGNVSLAAGQNKVCTITNNDIPVVSNPATIQVIKVVINDNGGTKQVSNFPLFVDSTSVTSGAVNTFGPASYIVSETNLPGYASSFSGDCDATGHLSLSVGQHKVCTITNNDVPVGPNPATIKVIKVVINDNSGTKQVADFPLFVNSTSVVSGAINTFTPGSYTVSETNLPGYASSFSGDCDANGNVSLAAGQNRVCTITNNDIGSNAVIPTCTLVASPKNVDSGGHSVLTWTTTNAVSFIINQGIGAVTPLQTGATTTGAITGQTTFTGTAKSSTGNTVECADTVSVNTVVDNGAKCVLTISPDSYQTGGSATLSWGGTNIQSVSIDNGVGTTTSTTGSMVISPTDVKSYTYTGTFKANNGQTLTCTAQLTVNGTACTSNCGGGGGGGGGSRPRTHVLLSSTPHGQVLGNFVYLSQIPQTGLDLGTVGTTLYWLALIAWAFALAYLVLFGAAPAINRRLRTVGEGIMSVLNGPQFAGTAGMSPASATKVVYEPHIAVESVEALAPEASRSYSSYDGFKSYAQNGALSIDDVVKGLARNASSQQPKPVAHTEPVYNHVEPVYENVEPIAQNESTGSNEQVTASVRGFTAALLEGDREALFAGLRQHVRGGGSAEQLISPVVHLLDDAYRARVDGTPCDPEIARMTARFSTPALEKLVVSLVNAIDSSYSSGVTGAKLALDRALTVLGA